MANYSRGNEPSLPSNNADLETIYSNEEVEMVSTDNNIVVGQKGVLQYMIHEFKNSVRSQTSCEIELEAKSDLAPSLSTVYLQIYNPNTNTWVTLDSNHSAHEDINFELKKKITNLTTYKDSDQVISCRVYQLAI